VPVTATGPPLAARSAGEAPTEAATASCPARVLAEALGGLPAARITQATAASGNTTVRDQSTRANRNVTRRHNSARP
jgi:anti-sigma factor RsiW